MEATVEKIEPLFKDQAGDPFWFLVKLQNDSNEYALHSNWFGAYGQFDEKGDRERQELTLGDRVEFEVSKAQLGKDGSQGIDRKVWLLFDKLRKIEEKGGI